MTSNFISLRIIGQMHDKSRDHPALHWGQSKVFTDIADFLRYPGIFLTFTLTLVLFQSSSP